MRSLQKETKVAVGIIALIIFSTVVGFYDRTIQSGTSTATVRVMPKPSVMVISFSGMITADGSDWTPSLVESVLGDLDEAKNTKSVKAIVLRINSPGGTVGASQEIFDAIMRFKKNSQKPVVASIIDVGASGAYWVALAADYIMAHPGSMVGSLGVITQTLDLTRVPEKYGVNVRTIKAGEHKDLLNPWREMSLEDTRIIQSMLDDVHQQFKSVLMQQRDMDENRASTLANGQIFSGRLAAENGLVDAVGSLHDAVQYAGSLANVDDPTVVYPNQGIKHWVSSFRTMFKPTLSIFDDQISHPLMR